MFGYHRFEAIEKTELEEIEDALREAQWRYIKADNNEERRLFMQMEDALKIALRIVNDAEDEIEAAEQHAQGAIEEAERMTRRREETIGEMIDMGRRALDNDDW